MKPIARLAGAIALIGTALPSMLYLAGSMELPRVKLVMLVATVVWFIAAPLAASRSPGEKLREETGQVVVP